MLQVDREGREDDHSSYYFGHSSLALVGHTNCLYKHRQGLRRLFTIPPHNLSSVVVFVVSFNMFPRRVLPPCLLLFVSLFVVHLVDAQTLRMRPLSIGSTKPAAEVIIPLGTASGRRAPTRRASAARAVNSIPTITKPKVPRPLMAWTRPKVSKAKVLPKRKPLVPLRSVRESAARFPIRKSLPITSEASPSPFAFQFESAGEKGTKLARKEASDASGKITGSYMLHDAVNGHRRLVTYVADNSGFRAQVITNEPGTKTSWPANVVLKSTAS